MVNEFKGHRRMSMNAGGSHIDPSRSRKKRRAHSTAGGISPLTRSRLSLGPVKSILKPSLSSSARAQLRQSNADSLDDANATQSMDITQDYTSNLHNVPRKSLGKRVLFNKEMEIREFKKDNTGSTSASASSPSPSSDDSPHVTDENDYPGPSRQSTRFSVAASDMDMTTIASPSFGRASAGSAFAFGESDDDQDMEITEVFQGELHRRQSVANTGRVPSTEVEEEQSFYSEGDSEMNYMAPLGQALRPASQDDQWLALKQMTHAGDTSETSIEYEQPEGDSMELEDAMERIRQARTSMGLANESISSAGDDSFGNADDGDKTLNLTQILNRNSLGGEQNRLSLGFGDTDSSMEMDESEVYGRIVAPSKPRQSIAPPTFAPPPVNSAPPLVFQPPQVFQAPPKPQPVIPSTNQAGPSIFTPKSPSKLKAAPSPTKKGPQLSAAFAPPVTRPTPRKSSISIPAPLIPSTASTAAKRPRPSEAAAGVDSEQQTPSKRVALANQWQSGPKSSTNDTPKATSDTTKPRPLSPSKRAPFQSASSSAVPPPKPSALRRPSGYFAQRKSLGTGLAPAAPPPVPSHSPKKKAPIGIGRASVGGPSDAWKRFNKNDPLPSIVKGKGKENVVVEIETPLPPSRSPSPQVAEEMEQIHNVPDLSNMLDEPMLEPDDFTAMQTTEPVVDEYPPDDAPQISIQEFLEITGIKFMDELTAPRRSIRQSMLARQPRDPSDIPLAEYTKAKAIYGPQLNLYTYVSKDLHDWMDKTKAEFALAEEEAAKMTPELFTEYARADEEGQAELLHQLQLMRANARGLAKGDWYNWKLKWIQGLTTTAEEAFDGLRQDAMQLEAMLATSENVVDQLQKEYDDVMQELHREEAEVAAIEECDQAYLSELKADIVEQNIEIETSRAEVEDSKAQIQLLQQRLGDVESELSRCNLAITNGERILHGQENSTRAEVFRLKDELEALEDLHMFHATKVNSELFEYIFASQFRVSIPCRNFLPFVEDITIVRTGTLRRKVRDEFPKFSDLTLSTAISYIRASGVRSTQQAIRKLSDFWASCKQLRTQLQHLAIGFPVEIVPLEGGAGFAARADVLFPTRVAKAQVSFVFDNETLARWPMSIRGLQYEVNVAYGAVEAEKVFEAVQTRLSEVTPGNCHACLMDACAVAQEQCC